MSNTIVLKKGLDVPVSGSAALLVSKSMTPQTVAVMPDVKGLLPRLLVKPISLEFIEKRYPDVKKVLFEGWLSGSLYNFNNYGHNEWTKVGETRGFA